MSQYTDTFDEKKTFQFKKRKGKARKGKARKWKDEKWIRGEKEKRKKKAIKWKREEKAIRGKRSDDVVDLPDSLMRFDITEEKRSEDMVDLPDSLMRFDITEEKRSQYLINNRELVSKKLKDIEVHGPVAYHYFILPDGKKILLFSDDHVHYRKDYDLFYHREKISIGKLLKIFIAKNIANHSCLDFFMEGFYPIFKKPRVQKEYIDHNHPNYVSAKALYSLRKVFKHCVKTTDDDDKRCATGFRYHKWDLGQIDDQCVYIHPTMTWFNISMIASFQELYNLYIYFIGGKYNDPLTSDQCISLNIENTTYLAMYNKGKQSYKTKFQKIYNDVRNSGNLPSNVFPGDCNPEIMSIEMIEELGLSLIHI